MFDLKSKGALVTGASGGIGGSIAKALHAQGATVAISGTNKEKLDALAAELGSARVRAALRSPRPRRSGQSSAEEAEKALGQVDILVNNAGVTHDNLFMRMKDEEWDDVIAVNLTSVFMLIALHPAQHDAPPCRADRQYRLDLRCSSAILARPNYAASKAGLVGMTKSLARGGAIARHNRQLHRAGVHLDAHDRRA